MPPGALTVTIFCIMLFLSAIKIFKIFLILFFKITAFAFSFFEDSAILLIYNVEIIFFLGFKVWFGR
jgi:hypothetical protein